MKRLWDAVRAIIWLINMVSEIWIILRSAFDHLYNSMCLLILCNFMLIMIMLTYLCLPYIFLIYYIFMFIIYVSYSSTPQELTRTSRVECLLERRSPTTCIEDISIGQAIRLVINLGNKKSGFNFKYANILEGLGKKVLIVITSGASQTGNNACCWKKNEICLLPCLSCFMQEIQIFSLYDAYSLESLHRY